MTVDPVLVFPSPMALSITNDNQCISPAYTNQNVNQLGLVLSQNVNQSVNFQGIDSLSQLQRQVILSKTVDKDVW